MARPPGTKYPIARGRKTPEKDRELKRRVGAGVGKTFSYYRSNVPRSEFISKFKKEGHPRAIVELAVRILETSPHISTITDVHVLMKIDEITRRGKKG